MNLTYIYIYIYVYYEMTMCIYIFWNIINIQDEYTQI